MRKYSGKIKTGQEYRCHIYLLFHEQPKRS